MAPESVRWLGDGKDFAFMAPDDRSLEFFLHYRTIVGRDYRLLAEGANVSHDAEAGEGEPKAANVQLTSARSDLGS
jgi:cold shock protein